MLPREKGRSTGLERPVRRALRRRRHQTCIVLCCLTPLFAGCGDGAGSSAPAAKKTTAAPAFRGGQYCFEKREAQYRAAGFTCDAKHLRKRG